MADRISPGVSNRLGASLAIAGGQQERPERRPLVPDACRRRRRAPLAGPDRACPEIGNKHGQAIPLGNLGLVYGDRGELDRAEEHYMKSLAIHEEIDDRLGQANQLGNLGLSSASRCYPTDTPPTGLLASPGTASPSSPAPAAIRTCPSSPCCSAAHPPAPPARTSAPSP